jgi:chromosomal replication initiation ATPase DnaA
VSRCVACDFALAIEDLDAAVRGSRRAVFARQVAMYLAHVGFALSFEVIGRAFGRDRTTVAHACRAIEDRRDDIWFDCRLATLELICRAALDGDMR